MNLEWLREQLYSEYFKDKNSPKTHYLAVDEGIYFLNQFIDYEKNEQGSEAKNLADKMDSEPEDEYDSIKKRAFKEGLKKFSPRLYSYYYGEDSLDDLLDDEDEDGWKDASEFDETAEIKETFVMPRKDILKILKDELNEEDYAEAVIGVDKAYECLNSYGEATINDMVEYFSQKHQYQWHGFKLALEKLEKREVYERITELLINKTKQ